jgi:predicted nucleic acid-binding protein
LEQTRSIAFYDALIIASAQTAGCNLLFSEDLNTGEVIAGVRLLDPFVLKV